MTDGAQTEITGGVTLDGLFRANVAAYPDALALIDPPDRQRITDGQPRSLSYAALNEQVELLAARLRSFGLAPGSVVAVQLPNIAEAVISLLAIVRAGHVAAPVPVLWRRSDLVAGLSGIAPRAMITPARLGGERPAETLCEVAAELFDLSFPCAFGEDVPDGVVPLDGRFEAVPEAPAARWIETAAVPIVTFDADADGFFVTGRSDPQWLAAGLATLLEAGIATGDRIVTTLPPGSLAAIGGALVPWLLGGGTLALAYDPAAMTAAAGGSEARSHLLAPAAAVADFAQRSGSRFASCIAVHRGLPARPFDASAIAADGIVDLYNFGETGSVVLRRDDPHRAGAIPAGPISAPSSAVAAPVVIETRMTDGQLWLRGPMVPRDSFPPGLGAFRIARDGDGFTRTGFKCHSDGNGGLIIDAGPERVIAVGGLRFGLNDLLSRFAACGHAIKVASIKDALLGERLLIEAEDRKAATSALSAAGHSQLVIEAAAWRTTSHAGK